MEYDQRVFVRIAALLLFLANVQSTYAEVLSTLMKHYGFQGTWSTNCAAVGDVKNVRTTYILSVVGPHQIETYVGGQLVSRGEVLELERLTKERYRMLFTSWPSANRDQEHTAWTTGEFIGTKRRVLDTIVLSPEGKQRVVVKDGYMVRQEANGTLTRTEPASMFEQCHK